MPINKTGVRLMGAASLIAAAAAFSPALAKDQDKASLTTNAKAALERCQSISKECARAADAAPGVLVFPNVIKASLIVGGSGAKGVLWVDNQIVGYYGLGEGSVGLQAGVKKSSQVYALSQDALDHLRNDSSWKIGADADVTVVDAGANATSVGGSGQTEVFVLGEKGLSAGVSVKGLDIFALNDNLERSAMNMKDDD